MTKKFPWERIRYMTVGRVVVEPDRVLLYQNETPTQEMEYHIIAKADCDINPGDIIEYEPFGANFGWFVGKCTLIDDEIDWQ